MQEICVKLEIIGSVGKKKIDFLLDTLATEKVVLRKRQGGFYFQFCHHSKFSLACILLHFLFQINPIKEVCIFYTAFALFFSYDVFLLDRLLSLPSNPPPTAVVCQPSLRRPPFT